MYSRNLLCFKCIIIQGIPIYILLFLLNSRHSITSITVKNLLSQTFYLFVFLSHLYQKKLHILDIVMEHFSRNNNNNDISEDVHSNKSHQSFQSILYVVLIRKFLLCSDLKYIYIYNSKVVKNCFSLLSLYSTKHN